MNWILTKNNSVINITNIPIVDIIELRQDIIKKLSIIIES